MSTVHADNFLGHVGPDKDVPNDQVDKDSFLENGRVHAGNSQVDAAIFLENVQLQFKSEYSKYKEFIRIMGAYKESKIDNREAVIRVCELLVGYPSLVQEFNAFLPNGYYLVPSDKRDGGESYITVKSPEGDFVCPKKQLVSSASNSVH